MIEQLWITCFVHNKEFDNFLKWIFYTSHSSYTLIFSFFLHYMNILHTCLLIHHMYIYRSIYIHSWCLRSLWQFNTRQTSVNESQRYKIACVTAAYIIIICLYIVRRTYFIFVYIYIYLTRWRNNLFHTKSSPMSDTLIETFYIHKNASLNHVCVRKVNEGDKKLSTVIFLSSTECAFAKRDSRHWTFSSSSSSIHETISRDN